MSLREELDLATATISSLKQDLETEKSNTSTANQAAVVIAQQYEERLANIALEVETSEYLIDYDVMICLAAGKADFCTVGCGQE